MRNRIRLSEGQLRRVIKESVYRILNEEGWDGDWYISDKIPQPNGGYAIKKERQGGGTIIDYYDESGRKINTQTWGRNCETSTNKAY